MFAWTRSVRRKVMLVVLATTLIALLVAAAALLVYESRSYRQAAIADLVDAGGHPRAGQRAGARLRRPRGRARQPRHDARAPQHRGGRAVPADGALFASYRTADAAGVGDSAAAGARGIRISGARIELFQPVIEKGERLGTVHLSASYDLAERRQGLRRDPRRGAVREPRDRAARVHRAAGGDHDGRSSRHRRRARR